ncbi:hypothetical protein [Brevibacterium casei]
MSHQHQDLVCAPKQALNPAFLEPAGSQRPFAVAGSLFAVPVAEREQIAELLDAQKLWIHADVFADPQIGVSIDLIRNLASRQIGPIDVHLLTAGAVDHLDSVCVPGVSRITFPLEGTPGPQSVAEHIRARGISPWAAIAPGTSLSSCVGILEHVDGLLTMLIPPGTQKSADLSQLAKAREAVRAGAMTGVDGGVSEAGLGDILAAGVGYIVVGRRLFNTSSSTL